jgi:hypothetical protein
MPVPNAISMWNSWPAFNIRFEKCDADPSGNRLRVIAILNPGHLTANASSLIRTAISESRAYFSSLAASAHSPSVRQYEARKYKAGVLKDVCPEPQCPRWRYFAPAKPLIYEIGYKQGAEKCFIHECCGGQIQNGICPPFFEYGLMSCQYQKKV